MTFHSNPIDWLEMWYAALRSPFGIVIETSDPVACRAKLYTVRAAANDPDLSALAITISPTAEGQVWIVKKGSKI